MVEKITAGRDRMGNFASKFAELNDDILFGQVWSRTEQLSLHDRSMITMAALMANGSFPQLKSHLTLEYTLELIKDKLLSTSHWTWDDRRLPWRENGPFESNFERWNVAYATTRRHRLNKERMAAFTDAVLAIIMTILVLELEKPKSLTLAGL